MHYSGYIATPITFSSTTWVDLFGGMTVVDVAQEGIARAGSVFTFAAAGIYSVRLVLMAANGSPNTGFAGIRLRRSTTTVAQFSAYLQSAGNGLWSAIPLMQLFEVPSAGGSATLQRCVQVANTPGTFSVDTLDGEPTRLASIHFHQVA